MIFDPGSMKPPLGRSHTSRCPLRVGPPREAKIRRSKERRRTIAAVAPTLLEYFARPTAFVGGQTVHLPYRGSDGHVYEIAR
jgi:hypothetical protein